MSTPSRGGVQDAAEVAGLVGDDADRAAVQAREAGQHVARPARADLEQATAVDERAHDVAHVVDAPLLGGHGLVGRALEGLHARPAARDLRGVLRQVVEQVAYEPRRVEVALGDELADAVALVHLRAAERGRVDVLAHDLLHDPRTGEEHRRALGHHHEVRQRGRVGAAAGRGPADHGDLRHLARQRDVQVEDPPVGSVDV